MCRRAVDQFFHNINNDRVILSPSQEAKICALSKQGVGASTPPLGLALHNDGLVNGKQTECAGMPKVFLKHSAFK